MYEYPYLEMTNDYEMLRISSDKENQPADIEGLANVP
jgi:hypothetical protein